MPIHPAQLYFEPFKNGASYEMNVNGAVTAVEFKITVPEYQSLVLHRINLHVLDAGMRASYFGGIATPLTNGVNIKILDADGNTEKDFTTTFGNIKQNSDFFMLAGIDGVVEASLGDDVLPIRWTVAKAGQPPAIGANGEMIITIQDDLTALTRFRAMAQGYLK